jgi:hypothetical protein
VLEQPAALVARFWDVDETFAARREHFRSLEARRRNAGVETYGGLAAGYLGIGHKTDATIAAAMGIKEVLDDTFCCSDPVSVLFDQRLLRGELVDELAPLLLRLRPTP